MSTAPLKEAIVTGSTGLLGRSICKALVADGFKVIGLSRTSPNNLPKEQAAFVETGLLVHHCFDLLSLTSADELIESIGLENPWLLVNNAGTYGPMEPFLGSDLDNWLTAFELNFLSSVKMTSAILKVFKNSGYIVNISGGGATKPMQNLSSYSAAKTALVRFTETIALDLAKTGIKCLAVAPGFLASEFHLPIIAEEVDMPNDFIEMTKAKFKNPDNPDLTAELISKFAKGRLDGLNGRLISSIFDNVGEINGLNQNNPIGHLRRIDDMFFGELNDN